MESPSGKKSNTKILLIVGAVLVVVLLIAVFYFVMQDDDEESNEELQVGDYLMYEYSGDANATMWLNVTEVNSTNYTLTATLVHKDGYVETPDPWVKNKSAEIIFWGEDDINETELANDFVGEEQLVTQLGARTVEHYRNESEYVVSDVYIGKDNGIIYRISITYVESSSSMAIALMETNIEWV